MYLRKEAKFKLHKGELSLFKFSLFNKGMRQLHPKRIIRSCYFDTVNLKMFHDSEAGILPRKKIRFRWYDNKKIINKEIKISSIEGRYKKTDKTNYIDLENLKRCKIYDKDYGILSSVLIVKYEREYFIYKKLRLTFDTNITYENIKSITNYTAIDTENVMEVKSSINLSDDYLDELIHMQTSRFSKYSRGILSFP